MRWHMRLEIVDVLVFWLVDQFSEHQACILQGGQVLLSDFLLGHLQLVWVQLIHVSRVDMSRITRSSLPLGREYQWPLFRDWLRSFSYAHLAWGVWLLVRVVLKRDHLFQILLLCDGRFQVYVSKAELMVWIRQVLFAHRGVQANDAVVEVSVDNLGKLGEGRLLNLDEVVLLIHSRRWLKRKHLLRQSALRWRAVWCGLGSLLLRFLWPHFRWSTRRMFSLSIHQFAVATLRRRVRGAL